MNNKISKHKLNVIYLLGFLTSLSIALPTYVNSTFLGNYIEQRFIGLIFTAGSILTLITFIHIPKAFRAIGNYRISILLVILNILLLIGLMTATTVLIIAPVFALYITVITLIRLNLDIFLENYSVNEETGSIRGLFFTISNAAWVISPVIVGVILDNGNFWKIYLVSALFLLPVLYMLRKELLTFKDLIYKDTPFISTLKYIKSKKDMYNIFMANFLLYFFYSWMIIYMPIYLYEYVGFGWEKIGVILTIMLLPFILFQFPAGKLADIKYGEKEFLVFGFIVMAFSSAILPFITSTNFLVWAGALFITRIGASMIEVMTETYFFKKIDGSETHLISVFRNNRSLAYIIAPLMASGFLFFLELKYLFMILGVVMLSGIIYSLAIEDTL